MMKRFAMGFVAVSLMIGGCAKNRAPESVSDMAPVTEPAEDYAEQSQALTQADLIAAAGADRVLFALDSSSLTLAAQAILTRQAAWLAQHPDARFTIEGHCDERGTRDYNIALGERRARAVAVFLGSRGISAGQLQTVSYGKERPEVTGSDESAYAENRRAVSIVIGTR